MAWEEMLLDNLLNFAATPKGLMLLQQTGATHECVAYMFTRFTKKLQVEYGIIHYDNSKNFQAKKRKKKSTKEVLFFIYFTSVVIRMTHVYLLCTITVVMKEGTANLQKISYKYLRV